MYVLGHRVCMVIYLYLYSYEYVIDTTPEKFGSREDEMW